MPAIRGNVTTLVASASRASGNSGILNLPALLGGDPDGVVFLVLCTVVNVSLDVFFQWSPDQGTTWIDFAHSSNIITSPIRNATTWARRSMATTAANTGVVATGDAALAAAVVINGPIDGAYFRAKWTVGGTPATFSILAFMDRD